MGVDDEFILNSGGKEFIYLPPCILSAINNIDTSNYNTSQNNDICALFNSNKQS